LSGKTLLPNFMSLKNLRVFFLIKLRKELVC